MAPKKKDESSSSKTSIFDKISANRILKDRIFTSREKEFISTDCIPINILFSGRPINGGIQRGSMTMMSAPAQHGKSLVGINCLKNAQKAGMQCIFINPEKDYDEVKFQRFGVDTSKLLVYRTNNIIEIKRILSQVKSELEPGEEYDIFVLFDSWGPLVTPTLMEKAEKGSESREMSLPYWKNELANLMLSTEFTYFVVNHVLDTMNQYDPLGIPGGRRLYHNCNDVVLCYSKSKGKDDDDNIDSALITAKVHKSRNAIEHSKIQFRIRRKGALDMFYGILDDALEHGCVFKPQNGRYSRSFIPNDIKFDEDGIYTSKFWLPIFKESNFEDWLEKKYSFKGRESDSASYSISDMMSGVLQNVKEELVSEED